MKDKKFLVMLPEELHKKIKMISVEKNISMAKLILKWLEEKVEEIKRESE